MFFFGPGRANSEQRIVLKDYIYVYHIYIYIYVYELIYVFLHEE